jgi:hypothetical protein
MKLRACIAAAVAVVVVAAPFSARSASADPVADDAVQHKALSDLADFTDWLDANGLQGYIGEVGWPNGNLTGETVPDPAAEAAKWNALAEKWYEAADAENLWVTAFSGGEDWDLTAAKTIYGSSTTTFDSPGVIDTALPQSLVTEAHTSFVTVDANLNNVSVIRGIHDIGGSFCAPDFKARSFFSNHTPYLYDNGRRPATARFNENVCYHYDTPASLGYLAAHHVDIVRLDVRWEQLQHSVGGRLSRPDVQHLLDYIRAANNEGGMGVIVDVHNYGHEYLWNPQLRRGVRTPIGSRQLPISAFADLWRKLSRALNGEPNVSYDLMNEPQGMGRRGAKIWERASQAAVRAIRARGDDHQIMVEGYNFSSVSSWSQTHPHPWITDPDNNFMYEGHEYFDRDGSGTYAHSYDEENTYLSQNGF